MYALKQKEHTHVRVELASVSDDTRFGHKTFVSGRLVGVSKNPPT